MNRMRVMTEKFKALVHYIVASCDDPQWLSAVRLNKVCWFSDTIAYRLNGVPITGETYVKRRRGPVPRTILRTLRDLEAEGKVHSFEKTMGTHKMRLFVPLKDADSSLFSKVELSIIESVQHSICTDHTAASINDLSHDQIWDAANEGEEIPLYATLAAERGELKLDVMAWGDGVVARVEARKAA
jgi:Protein of unknown function (DUF4065)